jgi:signal transduction histidine kinase
VLKIVVMDNGKGFDIGKKRKGIGISNMINRAESFGGTLNIKTAIGKGCQTTVTIPY